MISSLNNYKCQQRNTGSLNGFVLLEALIASALLLCGLVYLLHYRAQDIIRSGVLNKQIQTLVNIRNFLEDFKCNPAQSKAECLCSIERFPMYVQIKNCAFDVEVEKLYTWYIITFEWPQEKGKVVHKKILVGSYG